MSWPISFWISCRVGSFSFGRIGVLVSLLQSVSFLAPYLVLNRSRTIMLQAQCYQENFKPNVIKRNNWIKRAFNGILNTILMGGDDFGSVYSLQRWCPGCTIFCVKICHIWIFPGKTGITPNADPPLNRWRLFILAEGTGCGSNQRPAQEPDEWTAVKPW